MPVALAHVALSELPMATGLRAEAIRTLYRQARNSALAALVVTIYMVATVWGTSDHATILWWLFAQIIAQMARLLLVARFHASAPGDDRIGRWAHYYTAYMVVAGLLWGATAFLFIHAATPITIALTLCGLYGIAGGSVSGNAYNPAGLNGFVIAIFGVVLIRLLSEETLALAVLGVASAAYAGILILFCRVQGASIRESLQIRFENRLLLDQLVVQKEQADAARSEAEAANLAKSQFLAAASHDLRQPLYALSLLSGMLQNLASNPRTAEVVEQIDANITALEGLFNGLLDISRLDAGVIEAIIQPVNVDDLFDRINNVLGPIADQLGLDLRFRSDGTAVASDATLLEQILINLGVNALHYTRRGGVLIGARRRAGAVRFEVWDTGCGIAAADMERIFEEFVQIGNPERNREKGMGLGLAIVRRSTRLLGCDMAVRSVVGRGSLFCFSQPIAEGGAHVVLPALADDALPDARLPLQPGAGPVLVVEDDNNVRTALAALLAEWGVRADFAENGRIARQWIDEGRTYRLALVDYRLPDGVTGLDLIGDIRRRHAAPLPMTCLVTADMAPVILALAEAEQVPVLHKPLRPQRLKVLLEQAAAPPPGARAAPAIA